MLAEVAVADDRAVAQAFVQRGDALQAEVQRSLRALHYAGTVNTPALDTSLTALLADFGQWQAQLEDILLNEQHPVFVSLSSKVPLIDLYFRLVADLVRIKQTTAAPLQWSQWGEQFDLRVPRAVVWHYTPALAKTVGAEADRHRHGRDERAFASQRCFCGSGADCYYCTPG